MRIALPVALALVLGTSVAAADPTPDRVAAGERYREGLAALGRHDFDAARLALAQAHALVPNDPAILWDLAFAEYNDHRYVDAARHFRERLRLPDVKDSQREQAREFLATMAKELGHITIAAPPGALITMDGAPLLDDPRDGVDVAPGEHVIAARFGTQAKTVTVSPTAGESVSADLTMAEEPPAPAAPPPSPVPSGEPAGPAPVAPSAPSNAARIVTTASFAAVAVGAAVTGAVFLHTASSDNASAFAQTGSCHAGTASACAQSDSLAHDAADDKNVATGLFIGAGALAGAAIATWLLWAPRSHATSATWLMPQVSPTSAGIAAGGRF